MKKHKSFGRSLMSVAVATALLLAIPLVAMQFSDEVIWNWFDFLAAGVMLFGTGFVYRLITWRSDSFIYKAAFALAVGTALFLVWTNLAVGLIGSENNYANLMYLGVLVIAGIGSLAAGFKPGGMVWALTAAALAHAAIAGIALAADMQNTSGSSVLEILVVNGFFAVLWGGAALLFRLAEQRGVQAKA